MKLITFGPTGALRCGILLGARVLELAAAPLEAVLASAEGLAPARELEARALADAAYALDHSVPLASLSVRAPIVRPGKVLALGLNYRDHAAESGSPIPSEPVVFSKATSSIIGPGAPIVLPEASQKVDYEVEMAFVIGRAAKGVRAARALEHVAGYTVLNDVSARDYQREKPGGQWTLGKSFDTFCPMGPWLVTPDEVGDPQALALSCVVSGQRMQSSTTAQMIFSVAEIIEYLSRVLTLEPGDVVATGTPPGVGFVRKPPRYLRSGDVVECSVQNIGTLVNPVL
jgi:2-keto-4-pentenoate hydratase/2-oxohepta-3-ene-1,7-dioic acid hydratase in catechol pathway